VPRSRLGHQRGVREDCGKLGNDPWRCRHVAFPDQDEDGDVETGERSARLFRVEGTLGAEGDGGFLVAMPVRAGMMSPRGVVPPAIAEGRDGLPVVIGSITGRDRLEG
jgi:hypothetical protein